MTHLGSFRSTQFWLVGWLLLALCAGQPVRAQDTDDEEKKRLTLEKEKAVLRQEIAEAAKAEREAKYPKPTSAPLEGQTTINDNAVIESQMVAYVALAQAANKIVASLKVKAPGMTKLGIYNQQDINNLVGYRVAHTQLDLLQQGYCSILDTGKLPDEIAQSCAKLVPELLTATPTGAPGFRVQSAERGFIPALSLAESFLGAFVDLTALLRTDVEIKGQTFSMDEAALVAEVFRAARRSDDGLNGVTLYYPKFFPPKIINADFKSEILGRLEVLHFLKNKVEKLLNDLPQINGQIKKKEDERDALAAEIQSLEREISEAVREQARLEYLKTQYGAKTPFAADLRLAELIDRLPDLRQKKRGKELKKSQAEARLVALQRARRQIISELDSDVAGQLPDPEQQPDEFAAVAAKLLVRLAALNEQFAQLIAALKTAEQATGTNPLTRYILAEGLLSAMPWQENSYFLQLNVINAGGNNRIKTHLLWDIFTGGNRISHSGGVIVQFHLFNQDGQSLASDTLTEYRGYIKSGKIKKLPNRCIDELPDAATSPPVKCPKP